MMAKKLIENAYLSIKGMKESPVVGKAVIGISFICGVGGFIIGVLNARCLKINYQRTNQLSKLLSELGDSTLHIYGRVSKGEDVMDGLSEEIDLLYEKFVEKKEKEES